MAFYDVEIKFETMTMVVEAESAKEAKEKATEQFRDDANYFYEVEIADTHVEE